MKTKIARAATRGLAAFSLTCALLVCAHAQKTTLTFKNGKAVVNTVIRPRKETDAHFYLLQLRKGQTVAIKVVAGSLFLSKENECSAFFELFDGRGEAVFIGDSMVGIDDWDGEVERGGNYQIKVTFSCLEGFSASDLRRKKPSLKYSLTVHKK